MEFFVKIVNEFQLLTFFTTSAYSENLLTSKMVFFAKIVNVFQLLTFVNKIFVLDVCQDPEYTSTFIFSIYLIAAKTISSVLIQS